MSARTDTGEAAEAVERKGPMTLELHDYFAGQAIAGLADKNLEDKDIFLIAVNAYKLADQMIALKKAQSETKGKSGKP